MKNIKVNSATLYFLLISFLCGFIKNTIIIFGIVMFHELGHVFILKTLKYKINKITIYPFGGITTVDKDINTPLKHEFLIAIGGILFQACIFLIPRFISINIQTIELIYKYNITIMLFNLLPIIPLDGSILANILFNKFFSFKRSYILNFIISIISIILFSTINFVYSLNNYLIIMFLIFKSIEYIKNANYIYNKFLLERYLRNYKFNYIKTSKGNLNILKRDTYQYFIEDNKIKSEKEKLRERFDKKL